MAMTMKSLTIVAACLASSASAAVDMAVRYTDNMIDVGNLDAFAATWQTVYATTGNLQGVVTDDSYATDSNTCQTDDKKDLTVQVTMEGAWGASGNVTDTDMRTAMVTTMWSALEAIWNQYQYTVYEGCAGLTWQEAVTYTDTAGCGPRAAVSCADACADASSTPGSVQCDTATLASKLPSTLKVTAYEEGELLADELVVTFAATANDVSDGGCGIVGTITEQLATFIPVVGGLFAAGINFECNKV